MIRRLLVSAALGFPLLGAAAPAPSALSQVTYSGDPQALEALDREITTAGNDANQLAAIEQRLLQTLRSADTTFAARQAVAQRLGLVLGQSAAKSTADGYKPLGAMLADDRDSDLARLALERAPGATVDGLFVAALAKASIRTQLGLIDSIGRRRIVTAVPALTTLLKDPALATASAAARALGAIADPAAIAALQTFAEPSPPAIAAAKLAAATKLAPAAALGLLQELQRAAQSPIHRAAAFRLSFELDPSTAATRTAEVLGGSDPVVKQAALESLATSRSPNLTVTLCEKLATWDAPTQTAVIAALGRRGDMAAIPALTAAVEHKDPLVRSEAIAALGLLPGTRDTVALLARIAAAPDATDAKLARQSLTRLGGPDVSAAILAGADRGEPGTRAVFLEQLALRGMTEGLPLLLKTRGETNPLVRAAAVTALGDLAPASEQKALLDWIIESSDPTEQNRALRALVNVTLRNPSVAERGRPVYALLEFAQPDLAVRLMPVLGRLGGRPSADCAARLALRDDAKVSEAATNALARWTDGTALPALVTVAEKAAIPASRTAALDGALQYFERTRETWTAETTGLITRLYASTTEFDRRKKIVVLLHRANDADALAFVEGLKTEDALKTEAAIAAGIIRANLAGRPKVRASSMAGVGNIFDGNTATRWTTPALGEEWIEVDFTLSRPLTRITLDQTGRAAEFPEHFEVHVTDNPAQPGKALASGAGQRNKTIITLPAGTHGRYLIIKNTTERKDAPWAICELYAD